MTAEELERYGDKLFRRIGDFQSEVLKTIGRRIKATGQLSAFDKQGLKNIADISGDMEKITKRLAEITGMNIKDIQKIYGNSLNDISKKYKPSYEFRKIDFVPFAESNAGQALIEHWVRETAKSMLNLSRTSAIGFTDKNGHFKSVADTFQGVVDKAVFNVSTGVDDFSSAMRSALEEIGGSGIKVNYGSGVTRMLDGVLRSNILYGAKRASQAYYEHIGEELDCNGFEVDAHLFPRPSHEFMQGKQYSNSGEKTVDGITYEDGTKALEAMQDYGCLHYKMPIILGVNEPTYSNEYLSELSRKNKEVIEYNGEKRTGYGWKQEQRRIEREVRQQKLTADLAKSAGDTELLSKCNARIKDLQTEYNKLTANVGLQKSPERMWITKPLTTQQTSTIIISGGISGARNPDGTKALEHAERFYESVRKMKTDTLSISKNTGFAEEQIRDIKNYIFNDVHDLGDIGIRRFFPDYAMAESWQRLISGNIEPHDITLLKHELEEMKFVKMGKTQNEAHILASKYYNYNDEADKFYGKIKKFNDK